MRSVLYEFWGIDGENLRKGLSCLKKIIDKKRNRAKESFDMLNQALNEQKEKADQREKLYQEADQWNEELPVLETLKLLFPYGGETLTWKKNLTEEKAEQIRIQERSLNKRLKRLDEVIAKRKNAESKYVLYKSISEAIVATRNDRRSACEKNWKRLAPDLKGRDSFIGWMYGILFPEWSELPGGLMQTVKSFLNSSEYQKLPNNEEKRCLDGIIQCQLIHNMENCKGAPDVWDELPLSWDVSCCCGYKHVHLLWKKGIFSPDLKEDLNARTGYEGADWRPPLNKLIAYLDKYLGQAEVEEIMQPMMLGVLDWLFRNANESLVMESLRKWKDQPEFTPYYKKIEAYIHVHRESWYRYSSGELEKRYQKILKEQYNEYFRSEKSGVIFSVSSLLAKQYMDTTWTKNLNEWYSLELPREVQLSDQLSNSMVKKLIRQVNTPQPKQLSAADRQKAAKQKSKNRIYIMIGLLPIFIGATNIYAYHICILGLVTFAMLCLQNLKGGEGDTSAGIKVFYTVLLGYLIPFAGLLYYHLGVPTLFESAAALDVSRARMIEATKGWGLPGVVVGFLLQFTVQLLGSTTDAFAEQPGIGSQLKLIAFGSIWELLGAIIIVLIPGIILSVIIGPIVKKARPIIKKIFSTKGKGGVR